MKKFFEILSAALFLALTVTWAAALLGHAEIRWVRGRIRFEDEDGMVYPPAPFPSMVVVYNRKKAERDGGYNGK